MTKKVIDEVDEVDEVDEESGSNKDSGVKKNKTDPPRYTCPHCQKSETVSNKARHMRDQHPEHQDKRMKSYNSLCPIPNCCEPMDRRNVDNHVRVKHPDYNGFSVKVIKQLQISLKNPQFRKAHSEKYHFFIRDESTCPPRKLTSIFDQFALLPTYTFMVLEKLWKSENFVPLCKIPSNLAYFCSNYGSEILVDYGLYAKRPMPIDDVGKYHQFQNFDALNYPRYLEHLETYGCVSIVLEKTQQTYRKQKGEWLPECNPSRDFQPHEEIGENGSDNERFQSERESEESSESSSERDENEKAAVKEFQDFVSFSQDEWDKVDYHDEKEKATIKEFIKEVDWDKVSFNKRKELKKKEERARTKLLKKEDPLFSLKERLRLEKELLLVKRMQTKGKETIKEKIISMADIFRGEQVELTKQRFMTVKTVKMGSHVGQFRAYIQSMPILRTKQEQCFRDPKISWECKEPNIPY